MTSTGLNSIVPSLNHLAVRCLKSKDLIQPNSQEKMGSRKNMRVKPGDFNPVKII